LVEFEIISKIKSKKTINHKPQKDYKPLINKITPRPETNHKPQKDHKPLISKISPKPKSALVPQKVRERERGTIFAGERERSGDWRATIGESERVGRQGVMGRRGEWVCD
jgi:hypothetical protein